MNGWIQFNFHIQNTDNCAQDQRSQERSNASGRRTMGTRPLCCKRYSQRTSLDVAEERRYIAWIGFGGNVFENVLFSYLRGNWHSTTRMVGPVNNAEFCFRWCINFHKLLCTMRNAAIQVTITIQYNNNKIDSFGPTSSQTFWFIHRYLPLM